MNPRVEHVYPTDNHTLIIFFKNGEVREFDLKPYLDKGIFSELKNLDYFQSVNVVAGSIEWRNGQGLSYDTLYEAGIPVQLEEIHNSVALQK